MEERRWVTERDQGGSEGSGWVGGGKSEGGWGKGE